MGQMNRVVDQQKFEGSSLDEKIIPLTCTSDFNGVEESWVGQTAIYIRSLVI
jgi:hypothetical protein